MFLWIAFAALAAAVCLPLLLALGRAGRRGRDPDAADIYRDQLGELDRDVERGVIAPDEAAAARTEIARRLIRADSAVADEPRSATIKLRNAAAVAVLVMPVLALGLYLALGAPGLPDQPLVARLAAPPDQADLNVQLARIDQHLRDNPNDGRGWEIVAPVYLRVGRIDDAVTAYGNALHLLGSTADRELKYGMALVAANNGEIPQDAVAPFQRAAALAPADPTPHLYLALALQQQNKIPEAIAAWQALLASAPPDADWVPEVKAELANLQALPPGAGAASGPAVAAAGGPGARPGPTAAQVAAGQELPADQQAAMINGMVASLAARLDSDGSDADGWAQLVRSYVVLGRTDDARAALAKARLALAADQAKTKIVEEAARSAGLVP